MRRCRTCLMPDTRPRIVFDEEGICNACKWAEAKEQIDWQAREAEFRALVDRHRDRGPYDCIVPFSGGKDSAYIAYRLKFDFGLRPLLVTYGQLLWTECGRHNFDQVARLGFDIHYWRVDQAVSRKLARRFLVERGHPKLHYDAGVNAVPLITAVKFDIPLVIYAEHGESEYGGLVLSEDHRRERDLAEVLENQVGDDANNWTGDGISQRDLFPYIYPHHDEVRRVGVKAVYFSHFFRWASPLNYEFLKGWMDWHCAEGGRSEGTFTGWDSIDDHMDGLDFFLMFRKYGVSRAVRDANRHLQNGLMTYDNCVRLVRLYEGEFPERDIGLVLDYLGMSRSELEAAMDAHTNPELFTKTNEGWKFLYPL